MNRQYMSCLFLSLILTAPSLFGEEILTLYNNTIYPVTAEVKFCTKPTSTDCVLNSHSLAPGKGERIKIPTFWQNRADGAVEHYIFSIKATIPGQQEPIWEGGKVGGNVVGMKIIRQEKSVVFNPAKTKTSVFFVINANRNLSFINDIQQVENLAIYRFIQ